MKLPERKGKVKTVEILKGIGWMVLVNKQWFAKFSGEPPKEGDSITIGYNETGQGLMEIKYFVIG